MAGAINPAGPVGVSSLTTFQERHFAQSGFVALQFDPSVLEGQPERSWGYRASRVTMC